MTNYPLSSARISGLIDYFTCEITKLKSWLTLCEQFGDRGVYHDLLNIMYRHSCGFVSFSKCEHEKIYVEEVLKDFSLSLFSHWKKNFFSKFSHKIFVIILHDIIGLENFILHSANRNPELRCGTWTALLSDNPNWLIFAYILLGELKQLPCLDSLVIIPFVFSIGSWHHKCRLMRSKQCLLFDDLIQFMMKSLTINKDLSPLTS